LIYFLWELLFFLAALAVLFSVGTSAVILVILVRHCATWTVLKVIGVTKIAVSSLRELYEPGLERPREDQIP
jgi:hypothetical protein